MTKKTQNDPGDSSQLIAMLTQLFGNSVLGRIAVAVIVAVGLFLFARSNGSNLPTTTTTAPTSVSTKAPKATSGATGSTNGLPAVSFMQTPKEVTFKGCPPEGDGGDPVLNRSKNRVDEGNYQPIAFSTILNLPWPKEIERRDYANWPESAKTSVGRANGLPVVVEGYLAMGRQSGPESPNCHSAEDFDFHVWMIDHPGNKDDRIKSIVIEPTPRVRAKHPGWTVSAFNHLATAGTKVRISGWILLDPEHPDEVGQTRGTIWEVHPVMQVDVMQNNKWVSLDNYQP